MFDDMSVGEWLALTRWTVEMSGDQRDAHAVAMGGGHGGAIPSRGAVTPCEELAWALIKQAAEEIERRQARRKVTFAA